MNASICLFISLLIFLSLDSLTIWGIIKLSNMESYKCKLHLIKSHSCDFSANQGFNIYQVDVIVIIDDKQFAADSWCKSHSSVNCNDCKDKYIINKEYNCWYLSGGYNLSTNDENYFKDFIILLDMIATIFILFTISTLIAFVRSLNRGYNCGSATVQEQEELL